MNARPGSSDAGEAVPPDAVLPAYRRESLTDLLPSLAARLAVPGYRGTLEVPDARTYVVVLIDGFGWELLHEHRTQAPYLSGLALRSEPITVGCPSTTATSLTSLGTGLPPGEHGIAGYRFLLPEAGRLVQPLVWDTDADPVVVQPKQTVFSAIAAVGLKASLVVPARFEGSGLTLAALRGAEVFGLADENDDDARLEAVHAAVGRGPGVVYCYYRELDHTGHAHGVGSALWRARLSMVDAFCEALREELGPDVALLITGDHGMVDVPEGHRVTAEDHPELLRDVDLIAGEGRMRQLYTGQPDAVAARWAHVLGERAWVRTRDQAIDAGWFGPVLESARERFGDVLVAMRGDHAVMTATMPKEYGLVGMHGSLTSAEMLVPLLVD